MPLQAQLVWEALLYLQPAIRFQPHGRAALESLISSRMEDAYFSHCLAAAERKRLVPLSKENDRVFMLVRVTPSPQGARGQG